MGKPQNEGLSIGYRIRYRLLYTMLFVLGPAQQSGMKNPHNRMRAEREAKVAAARAERLAREGRTDTGVDSV